MSCTEGQHPFEAAAYKYEVGEAGLAASDPGCDLAARTLNIHLWIYGWEANHGFVYLGGWQEKCRPNPHPSLWRLCAPWQHVALTFIISFLLLPCTQAGRLAGEEKGKTPFGEVSCKRVPRKRNNERLHV